METRGKLDSKTQECIFLRYENGTKGGYRLLTMNTRKVIIRREVVYHEDQFLLRSSGEASVKILSIRPVIRFGGNDVSGLYKLFFEVIL